MQLPSALPSLSPPKRPPKIHHEQNFLYFRKWNFPGLMLKKLLYFLKRKPFLQLLKTIFFLYFRKQNPALFGLNPQNFYLKKFLIFFLRKFLIFPQKNAFLIFLEVEPCTFQPKLKE